jgi:nucleotide sugar dehydrogenase
LISPFTYKRGNFFVVLVVKIYMQVEKIGFIGQGWIGKNFADDFEERGYEVVRYDLKAPYSENKDLIKTCDLVYIAVPTPTTPQGFSCEPVIDALTKVRPGAIAVIKSTILPGTTKKLQTLFPNIFVLHSPEFLVEKTVKFNVQNPERNIIGVPVDNHEYIKIAGLVLSTLPKAQYEKVMDSNNAELLKYAGNTFLTSKVLFMNILYDLVEKNGGDWNTVRDALVKDTRIGESHTMPVYDSGRGAGGHCFIKDFEAFRQFYVNTVDDKKGQALLKAMTEFNIDLLTTSKKSLDVLTDTFEFKIKD